MSNKEEDVLQCARTARENAYAPYSNFKVGAALLSADDRIFTGCNVENISFGLTMCAERVALGAAITEGQKDFHLLAIVSDSEQPVVPCGACRQVLAECNPTLRIISANLAGEVAEFSLNVLLPLPQQGILK